jgi:hypothetical protein
MGAFDARRQRKMGSSSGATSTSMLRATPGLLRISPDSFERQHHLVDRGWADTKVVLEIGFRGRSAVYARVAIDEGQILALLVGEIRHAYRAPARGGSSLS